MLILTRKTKETIQIGDGITVTVTHIYGSRVRLGIDAPGIVVRRGEVVDRDLREGGGETKGNDILDAPGNLLSEFRN